MVVRNNDDNNNSKLNDNSKEDNDDNVIYKGITMLLFTLIILGILIVIFSIVFFHILNFKFSFILRYIGLKDNYNYNEKNNLITNASNHPYPCLATTIAVVIIIGMLAVIIALGNLVPS